MLKIWSKGRKKPNEIFDNKHGSEMDEILVFEDYLKTLTKTFYVRERVNTQS